MNNWKPGDFALVVPTKDPEITGQTVRLIKYQGIANFPDKNLSVANAWHVKALGYDWTVDEKVLQPLPPEEAGDWEDCIFKPTELVKCD